MSSPSILSKNIEDKSSTTEIAPPQHNQLLPLQPRQDVQKHLLDVLHVDHER